VAQDNSIHFVHESTQNETGPYHSNGADNVNCLAMAFDSADTLWAGFYDIGLWKRSRVAAGRTEWRSGSRQQLSRTRCVGPCSDPISARHFSVDTHPRGGADGIISNRMVAGFHGEFNGNRSSGAAGELTLRVEP
jgi:hypothetical protein